MSGSGPGFTGTGASLGYEVPVLLLDTLLDENAPEDRDICRALYGGDDAYRLSQEIVLGIGGYRLLRALGFDIETYHMNEGHSALLALELLHGHRRGNGNQSGDQSPGHAVYDPDIARQRCVFTTHTPVEAGHDRFPYDLVERKLAGTIDTGALKAIAGTEGLNMTRLALNLSGYVNGVAKRHAEISQKLFPGYRVHAITNGVHVETWTCESFAQLYQDHFPNWRHEPEVLVRADGLDDAAVWEAHQRAKLDLLSRVSSETGNGSVAGRPDPWLRPAHDRVQAAGPAVQQPGPVAWAGAGPSVPDRHRRQGAPARRGRQAHHPGAAPLQGGAWRGTSRSCSCPTTTWIWRGRSPPGPMSGSTRRCRRWRLPGPAA